MTRVKGLLEDTGLRFDSTPQETDTECVLRAIRTLGYGQQAEIAAFTGLSSSKIRTACGQLNQENRIVWMGDGWVEAPLSDKIPSPGPQEEPAPSVDIAVGSTFTCDGRVVRVVNSDEHSIAFDIQGQGFLVAIDPDHPPGRNHASEELSDLLTEIQNLRQEMNEGFAEMKRLLLRFNVE